VALTRAVVTLAGIDLAMSKAAARSVARKRESRIRRAVRWRRPCGCAS